MDLDFLDLKEKKYFDDRFVKKSVINLVFLNTFSFNWTWSWFMVIKSCQASVKNLTRENFYRFFLTKVALRFCKQLSFKIFIRVLREFQHLRLLSWSGQNRKFLKRIKVCLIGQIGPLGQTPCTCTHLFGSPPIKTNLKN